MISHFAVKYKMFNTVGNNGITINVYFKSKNHK